MNLSSIFEMVLLSSAMGSVVAFMVVITKRIFKNKFSPAWHYYIWIILLIRLIIPNGFQSQLSVFNVFKGTPEKMQIYQSLSAGTSINELNYKKSIGSTTAEKTEVQNNLPASKKADFHFYINIIGGVWAAGVIIMILIILTINCMLFFRVGKQSVCEDEETNRALEECKSIMKVSCYIPVINDKYAESPSLFGFIKPKILVNPELVKKLSYEEKKYIFLHEIAHLKRKDILISQVMLLLQSLHWFNPVIWFSFNQMWKDSETACDACALSCLDSNQQSAYGKTIINLIKILSEPKWIPGVSGIVSHKSNIEERITMIANFKKISRKRQAVSICIFASLCIFGLTNSITGAANAANVAKIENKTEQITEQVSSAGYINAAQGFLPQNAKLINPFDQKKMAAVLEKDIDNDGKNEIIAVYKSGEDSEKVGILVIKKVNGNWAKALDTAANGFQLDKVFAADLDGDGKNELVLGSKIGSLNQLYIYKWNNNLLNKMSSKDINYSKVDVINITGIDRAAVALWSHDTGKAYIVDVMTWNGNNLASVKAPDYFKNTVVPYYEQMVKESPKGGFYWYYLADAQIKAGQKKDALKSISQGLSLNTGYPSKEQFNKLKDEALK